VIGRFADALATFSDLDDPHTRDAVAFDPMSSEMLNAAVSKVSDRRINDVHSLNQEIVRFVTELRDHAQELNLSLLITFYLTIHDFILKNRTFSGVHEKGVFDYDHNYTG